MAFEETYPNLDISPYLWAPDKQRWNIVWYELRILAFTCLRQKLFFEKGGATCSNSSSGSNLLRWCKEFVLHARKLATSNLRFFVLCWVEVCQGLLKFHCWELTHKKASYLNFSFSEGLRQQVRKVWRWSGNEERKKDMDLESWQQFMNFRYLNSVQLWLNCVSCFL